MKQSTKLLSLVLAIVMAFSCMSVIGSAADSIPDHNAVTYDSIDDALLTIAICLVLIAVRYGLAHTGECSWIVLYPIFVLAY